MICWGDTRIVRLLYESAEDGDLVHTLAVREEFERAHPEESQFVVDSKHLVEHLHKRSARRPTLLEIVLPPALLPEDEDDATIEDSFFKDLGKDAVAISYTP